MRLSVNNTGFGSCCLLLAGVVALTYFAGCSRFVPKLDEVVPDKRTAYRKSETLPDLEVPPDLTTDAIQDRMAIPEGGTASYSTYQQRRSQQQGRAATAPAAAPAARAATSAPATTAREVVATDAGSESSELMLVPANFKAPISIAPVPLAFIIKSSFDLVPVIWLSLIVTAGKTTAPVPPGNRRHAAGRFSFSNLRVPTGSRAAGRGVARRRPVPGPAPR